MKKPVHKDVWNFDIDGKVYIEIVHWGVDREDDSFGALNDGKGVWNYYITLTERVLKEKFEEVWLLGKKVKWSDAGAEHLSYDYMSQPFANVDWHCGITFYERIGQEVGFRAVKLGCDYSHLYDQESGYSYTMESVLYEAKETANQLINLYKL